LLMKELRKKKLQPEPLVHCSCGHTSTSLVELLDNRRLRHLPNDLPTRFLVIVVFVVLVCKV
jgi:hypothetical protein